MVEAARHIGAARLRWGDERGEASKKRGCKEPRYCVRDHGVRLAIGLDHGLAMRQFGA